MKTYLSAFVLPMVVSSLVLSESASAASLILASEGGWNGFGLEGNVRAGFRQAGGIPGIAKEVVSTDFGVLLAAPDVHAPGTTLTMAAHHF